MKKLIYKFLPGGSVPSLNYSVYGDSYNTFLKDMNDNLKDIDDDERNFLIYIAANESGFKDVAYKPISTVDGKLKHTAAGRFQMIDSTWNNVGGGERNTANDFKNMHNLYRYYDRQYNKDLKNYAESKGYDKSVIMALMHYLGVGGTKLYTSKNWNSFKEFNDEYMRRFFKPDHQYIELPEKIMNNILKKNMYTGAYTGKKLSSEGTILVNPPYNSATYEPNFTDYGINYIKPVEYEMSSTYSDDVKRMLHELDRLGFYEGISNNEEFNHDTDESANADGIYGNLTRQAYEAARKAGYIYDGKKFVKQTKLYGYTGPQLLNILDMFLQKSLLKIEKKVTPIKTTNRLLHIKIDLPSLFVSQKIKSEDYFTLPTLKIEPTIEAPKINIPKSELKISGDPNRKRLSWRERRRLRKQGVTVNKNGGLILIARKGTPVQPVLLNVPNPSSELLNITQTNLNADKLNLKKTLNSKFNTEDMNSLQKTANQIDKYYKFIELNGETPELFKYNLSLTSMNNNPETKGLCGPRVVEYMQDSIPTIKNLQSQVMGGLRRDGKNVGEYAKAIGMEAVTGGMGVAPGSQYTPEEGDVVSNSYTKEAMNNLYDSETADARWNKSGKFGHAAVYGSDGKWRSDHQETNDKNIFLEGSYQIYRAPSKPATKLQPKFSAL